jgi:3-isopropylmalate/(R)-2-methylmalate dehydratase small subunit
LPIVLDGSIVQILFDEVRATEGYSLSIDLEKQQITKPDGTSISFNIPPFLKQRLLNGWDQIGLTLRNEDKITEYEKTRALCYSARG